MTTPDYPDWTTPVGLLDQAEALLAVGATITANGATVTVDTSGSASVAVLLFGAVSTVTDMYVLDAQWLENGAVVAHDVLSFWGETSAGFTPSHEWQLPARGGQLQLVLSGTASPAVKVGVTGSSRPIADARVSRRTTAQGRLLLDTGGIAIPAGGSSAFFQIPPATSRQTIRLNMTASTIQAQLNAIHLIAGVPTAIPFLHLSPDGSRQLAQDYPAPGMALQVLLFNGDAAAHTMHAYFWDVS